MNNKMITIPYADAIEYGENTSALFKALWELTDLADWKAISRSIIAPTSM